MAVAALSAVSETFVEISFTPRSSRSPGMTTIVNFPTLPTAVGGVPRLALRPDEAAAALGISRDYFDESPPICAGSDAAA